ncbi:hypothetical protein CVIRNUC_006092 [Coccomyxa viridis]|uniref:non-specific serine/threonine protein kinase n=1 Tax=Coccomyxa viridis TaxID=1274662 RepID=A0AAV1I799_9CHLO|nr:hypothetical protein CVIRNUC_006092 [Coccomyxa viridis]
MQKPPGAVGPRSANGPPKPVKRRQKKQTQTGQAGGTTAREESAADEARGSDSDAADSSDDEGTEGYKKGGYHPVQIGDLYKDGRYKVIKKLGWGHFSTVWLVEDSQTGHTGALKVQKSASHYTEAARDEITLLTQIRDGDPSDSRHCVRLHDWFEHRGPHGLHICMVFEVLGDNLLSLIKAYSYRNIPLHLVKHIAKQVLISLDYIHRKLGIIHTDLKPENVMLTATVREPKQRPPSAASKPSDAAPNGHAANPEGHLATAAASGQALTKNQKKKLKKKLKKAGAGSQTTDSGQQPDASHTDSDGSCGTGLREKEMSTADGPAAAQLSSQTHRADSRLSANVRQQPQPNLDTEQPAPADPEALTAPEDAMSLEERVVAASAKVVDFGNACWVHKQFTSDIQTRQYRCPEVLLGAKYSTPADMWSLACMVFELATGDLLFDPRSGKDYDRDEDHLALFIELLGRMPRRVCSTGRYAKDYFNRHGELRHIKKLRFWPLERVLHEKYEFPQEEAELMADFLQPMLEYEPERRGTARDMLSHPWLKAPVSAPAGRRPSMASAATAAAPGAEQERTRRRPTHFDVEQTGSPTGPPPKRSRSPSPSPPPRAERREAAAQLRPSEQSTAEQESVDGPNTATTSPRNPSSLASSGVLLSPGSAAAEKVGASTVMVSKTDAASRPVTPEQKTRPGSAATSQGEEWQIL